MDNTLISKITAVCVVLLMVGLVAIPLIQAANTEEETVTTTYTYGNNAIHDVNVSTVIGNVASSGASYTFSEDAGGDWMLIPSYVLRDTQLTYKVLDGAYIYVPDSATTYAQYTVNGTEIPVTGMSLTFTQDTSITDATVYDLTVNVTDMSLPGVVIEQIITINGMIPISNIAKVYGGLNQSFYITTTGDLYGTGYNSYGVLGTGDNVDVTTWTKVAENVREVVTNKMSQGSSYYISTSNELYATGYNNNGQLGDGTTTNSNTWTKVADNVAKVKPFYGNSSLVGAYYLSTTGELFAVGKGGYGFIADGTDSITTYQTWTKVADNVIDFGFKEYNDRGSLFYINNSNELYVKGYNNNGQLGDGTTTSSNTWTKVADNVANVYYTPVQNGNMASFYITTTGDLYASGKGDRYIFGNNSTNQITTWTQVATGVSDVYTGGKFTLYLGTDHNLYAAGNYSGVGSFGTGLNVSAMVWTQTATNVNSAWTRAYDYYDEYSAYISSNSELYLTGNNSAIGLSNQYTWADTASNVSAFNSSSSSMGFYAFYVTNSHNLAYIGNNAFGQLGTGDTTNVTQWTVLSTSQEITLYTNPSDSVTISDVRGNVANGVFTPSETGTYLKVNSTNLQYETYYIGDGRTYYVAQNGTVSETKTAPDATGLSHASLTFTALADPDKIYTIAGTTDAGYEVIIPYTASYDVTETVVTEKFPLIGIIPVIFVIMAILFVVNMIPYGRSGL